MFDVCLIWDLGPKDVWYDKEVFEGFRAEGLWDFRRETDQVVQFTKKAWQKLISVRTRKGFFVVVVVAPLGRKKAGLTVIGMVLGI